MANAFDQFDEVKSNPFDEFDDEHPILKKIKQVGKDALGGLDAAANVAAGIPSYIYSGYAGLGDLMLGKGGAAAGNAVEAAQQSNFGLGAPKPFTQSGQDAVDMLGHGQEAVVNAAGNMAGNSPVMRSINEGAANLALNFLPLPGGKGVRALGKRIEAGLAKEPKAIPPIAEGLNEAPKPAGNMFDQFDRDVEYGQIPPDASIPANRMDGYQLTRDLSKLPVDENGMPSRQPALPPEFDNSLNARNEARRMYDEPARNAMETAVQEADGPLIRPEQDGSERLQGPMNGPDVAYPLPENIPASEGVSGASTASFRAPRNQRGAIDPELMTMGASRFLGEKPKVRIVEEADGLKAFIGDQQVGYLKDNLPRGMAERLGENANVDIVKVAPAYQGMGIGKELYAAFNDRHGGNIAPSGKTSPSAWQLWKRNYPDKVASFVDQEAGRIKEGAPLEQVVSGITDPEVRRAVVEQLNPLKVLDAPDFVRSGSNRFGVGQRGAINTKAIADAVKKMKDMIAPVELPSAGRLVNVKGATESMKVPGLGSVLKDWIPSDPKVADVKAAVLAEGTENGKLRLSNLRSGAVMAGEQRKSALIKAAASYVLNGVKRADYNIRNVVQPVEAFISRMPSADIESLAGVFKDEMFKGMQYSDAQLTKLLNPKQIESYKAIRDMFNQSLAKMNEARVKNGMEPVTPKEGYLASRWGGRFRIPVYDTTGKLVWYIAENSKRGATKALEYLDKQGIPIDKEKSKLEIRGSGDQYQKNNRGYLEDSYLNMLSVLDKNDPRVAHVKSIMEDAMSDRAYDSLGQAKHFEPKNNVRGFIGDRPWRNSTSEAYAMFRGQMDYAKNAFKWSESQEAVGNVKQLLADKDIQAAQPHNAEFVRQYVKNHLGYGEHPIISSMEKWVSEKLGYDRGIAAENVQIAKSIFLTQKLVFNLGYYASQGLQMLNSIPEHGYLTSQGYKHNFVTTLAKANIDFAAGMGKRVTDVLSRGKMETNPTMTSLGKDAWQYMVDNGIVQRNIFDEAQGLGEHPTWETVKGIIDKPIAMSEQIIRTHSFLQFAHHLEQSGKFKSRSEVFAAAEEATNRAMVDFRREERAAIFEQTGIVGSAASTLKSYLVNYYNNMARYSQEAVNGKPRALMYALALQGGVYGVLNLPGMQEANDAWEAFKKVVPDSVFDKIKDINIRKMMVDLQGDWAYGGISKVTGANLANRGSVAIDQSMNPLDGLFPFISGQLIQATALGKFVISPNRTTFAQAAYAIAPAGFPQGMIANTDAFKAGQREDGTTVFQKPSKLDQHEFDYARTPSQEAMKKWGFTPVDEARVKDLTYMQSQDDKSLNDRRKDNVNKAFDALVRNDDKDFTKAKDYFMSFNGDPDDFVNGLVNEAFKQKVSMTAMQAIKSDSNLTSLQKIAKIKALVGSIK